MFGKKKEIQLQKFLLNEGPDNRGRYVLEILSKDNYFWEHTHDFIQWIFPTDKKSWYNRKAPVLTEKCEAPYLLLSLQRYKQYLETVTLTPYNHNCLRISRILRSLSLLSTKDIAKQFLMEMLERTKDRPEFAKSRKIWMQQVF